MRVVHKRPVIVWALIIVVVIGSGWFCMSWFMALPLAESRRAYGAGDYLLAASLAEARLAQQPADQEAMLIAARGYAHLERWPAAEAYFAQIPLRAASDFHLRARGLVARDLVLEAATVYEQILQRWPVDGEALQRLAAIRGVKQARFEEALILVRRLSQIPSHRIVGLAMVGKLELGQNNLPRAVEAFEAAVRQSPDLKELPPGEPPDVFYSYAEALLLVGRIPDAEKYAMKAYEQSSGPEVSFLLAQIRQQLGDEKGARRYWEDAVARDPRFVPALRELGQLCLVNGKPSEALRWFLRAQEVEPDNAAIKYCLDTTYRHLGKTEEAKKLNESRQGNSETGP